MIVIHYILLILVIVFMLPVTILLTQVLTAIFFSKKMSTFVPNIVRPSIAILVPAHNESLVIAETLESILPQLSNQDQLLVVADNCTDDTTTIAKNLGAKVIERNNLILRGKGYALDFGLQHLNHQPPEVVIIVDADCIVSGDAIQLLALACASYQRPIQALYLMDSQPQPSLKARIAEFAWLLKNKVRPLGFKALGLPCQLMGTGMAFLWEDIKKTNLASGHLVEDMKLGVDFTRVNKAPMFLPEALVKSVFPPTQEATNTQRARWEHGHLSVILNEAPSMLYEAIKLKNLPMFGLACDLIVPPIAVLSLLCAVLFVLSIFFATQLAILLSTLALICLTFAVLLAWFFFGQHIISLKQLCYAPIYALIKIPLYIKFFFNRQVDWVRSKRD